MAQAPNYPAQVLKGSLRLSCCTYTKKRATRVIGKILWAATHSRLPPPFLQGPMAWTTWGPPCAPYTPPKVLDPCAMLLPCAAGRGRPKR